MNENKKEIQAYEYEIDLKELLMVLWKNKIKIIGIALIGAILASILSIFVLSPVYDTDLKIDVNMPDTYTTKYGEYKLPVSTNAQYFKLITSNDVIINTLKDMGYKVEKETLKKMKENISVGNIDTLDTKQNVFDVKVSAESAEESLKLAKTLYANYIEYVDMLTRGKVVDYFYDSFNASLKGQQVILESTKNILKKNEETLSKTPQTINQSSLVNSGNNMIIENIINPEYEKLQEKIVENKQLISSTEENIRVYKKNIEELDLEKKVIEKYYETGVTEEQKDKIVNIAETSIYLLSEPVAPLNKTSPNNLLNAIIGLIIGGILATVIVLVKEYWLKKE